MNNILEEQDLREIEFQTLFEKVQRHTANYHSDLLQSDNAIEQLTNSIRKYLVREKMIAEGCNLDGTIQKIINEMTGFSILSPYLDPNRVDIEEININRWDDVKVSYSNGTIESIEHFFSAKHCEDIFRRLLSKESTLILDKSRPVVRGHLNNKIRITVMGDGIIDSEVGIAASIRIVNPKNMQKEDFVRNGTSTDNMITLLETLFQNGVSMCITGETGSGKTTLMSYILTQVDDEKRVFTIEEDTREFNLVKRDENGKVINNVIHTTSKKSDDPAKEINQEKLLETAMTINPDVICVAEMKGQEALASMEAANTGHTMITTTHANSCRATYSRMADLCQSKTNMEHKDLVEMAKSAFPIVVFIKRYKDKVRRVKEITECIRDDDGNTKIVTLFRYKNGNFERVNRPSNYLKELLLEEEVAPEIMDIIFGKEE